MKVIKLMPEYECWPLWYTGPEKFGDIDPRSLGLSDNLVKEISGWAKAYDATLNHEYPPDSRFNSREDAISFVNNGFLLQKKISEELSGKYHVEYDCDIGILDNYSV
ncbi:hypothetical protein [Asaia sp. HN128]|uniref:hypothetical protein n=1 Tax=Asaia sp. HN128 TaxID=3081234 RepID=UPI00301894E3